MRNDILLVIGLTLFALMIIVIRMPYKASKEVPGFEIIIIGLPILTFISTIIINAIIIATRKEDEGRYFFNAVFVFYFFFLTVPLIALAILGVLFATDNSHWQF